jgi:hypothetical protein
MKTTSYIIILLMALMLAGCGLVVVDGAGRIAGKSPAVSGFEAVSLAGNGQIIIQSNANVRQLEKR